MLLQDLVQTSAEKYPDNIAVYGPDGTITYQELDKLANQIAYSLQQKQIGLRDRVGILMDKSIKTIAAMQAVLRIGAVYVPIDPFSPLPRVAKLITNCQMRALLSNKANFLEVFDLIDESVAKEINCTAINLSEQSSYWNEISELPTTPIPLTHVIEDSLAYILYTSGSTGEPKGVCISHRNALAFIEWAAEYIKANSNDRFSNHAAFHFDLSVLDLYVAFLSGASVSIVPESIAYIGKRLVEFARNQQITVWYSVPSALILMLQQGNLLEDGSGSLRTVIFAGEPFPIKYLRQLKDGMPDTQLINMYGPTETNVCTFYDVKEIDPEQTSPVPIGVACSGDTVWAVKTDGTVAEVGEEGELLVSGPTVMLGYWGKQPQGNQPYNTGDIVKLLPDGNYNYIGRKDHMVKIRGYRVELGDIEAALLSYPEIKEAAVIVHGSGMEARLVAFLSSEKNFPLLEIKRRCANLLPRYMIVDEVHYLASLPKTVNGKIDRITLKQQIADKQNA